MNTAQTWFDIINNFGPVKPLAVEQYQDWQQHLVFDLCRGKSKGESFCEYFGLRDNLLLYNVISDASIESYIRDTYLET